MSQASLAFQIMVIGEPDVNKRLQIIDSVLEVVKQSGFTYEVGPFETTIEGNYSQIMALLDQCIKLAGQDGDLIQANIKVNYSSQDEVMSIAEKVTKHR